MLSGAGKSLLKKLLPLLLPFLLLLMSCDVSSPEDATEMQIKDILYEIGKNYNWGNVAAIMEYVSVDYRHNGMQRMQLEQLWLDRMARYPLMEIKDLRLEISSDYAVAHFTLSLVSSSQTKISQEPGENGDLSYFYHDGYSWKLHGNQEYIKR